MSYRTTVLLWSVLHVIMLCKVPICINNCIYQGADEPYPLPFHSIAFHHIAFHVMSCHSISGQFMTCHVKLKVRDKYFFLQSSYIFTGFYIYLGFVLSERVLSEVRSWNLSIISELRSLLFYFSSQRCEKSCQNYPSSLVIVKTQQGKNRNLSNCTKAQWFFPLLCYLMY